MKQLRQVSEDFRTMRALITSVGTLVGGGLLYVAVLKLLGIVGKEPWMSIALFGSFIVAGVVSWRIAKRLVPPVKYPTLADLKQQGLIETVEFSAKRAFQVYGFDDEGPSDFVELTDGRVLHLWGQYLDDLAEITDDPGNNQSQLFPCARFRVTRRRDTGQVYAVEPLSPCFGLDAEFPPFTLQDLKAGWRPANGAILTESYDVLKGRVAGRGISIDDPATL